MLRSEVWVLQHAPAETLGTITDALEDRKVTARYVRIFQRDAVPQRMDGRSGLVVMGGPLGVYEQERYPFLKEEVRLIKEALSEGKPVLGICLGSQLLASALEGLVSRGHRKEIGWHPVRLTEDGKEDMLFHGVERSFTAYHWHGDVFELPRGAVALASSDRTQHQAFRFGANAYGLLFHLEVTENMVREMIRTFSDDLREEKIDMNRLMKETQECLRDLQKISAAVFGQWAGLAADAAAA